jgi:hypothetical protein
VAIIFPVASEVAISKGIGLLWNVGLCSKERSLIRCMEAPLSIIHERGSSFREFGPRTFREIWRDTPVDPDGEGELPGKKSAPLPGEPS